MRIAVIGRTEILYETAERLHALDYEIGVFITAKEAPEYTKNSDDFNQLAQKLGVPFFKAGKADEALAIIQDLPAMDIAVSVNYSGILPQSVIDCFRLGILNAHGGALPRYRGNACQAWAILNGEERVGLCIQKMIGGELDTGDIVARDYYPLSINTKVTEVWDWMSSRIPELFEDALTALAKNSSFRIEQQSKDPKDALRCYPRRPEDGRIDWGKSAIDILRIINACNKPYAGAFCVYEGEKLIIWDADLVNDDDVFLATPGQVTKIDDGYIEIAAGEGKLRILQVEYNNCVTTPNKLIHSIRKRLT